MSKILENNIKIQLMLKSWRYANVHTFKNSTKMEMQNLVTGEMGFIA
jgi:hypothetical protein